MLVLGRTSAKCDAVVAEIEARGGEATAHECDVEHRDQVEASVQRAVDLWGRIDLLVNNAQTMVYRSLRKMTEADMETMWQSGPMGALRFMQACFPHLRATQGCIVNMGSGSSVLPHGTMGGYAMAKEAIRVLYGVGAVEWGRHGIRVVAICPLAATPGLGEFGDTTPGAVDSVLSTIPLGRWGDPSATSVVPWSTSPVLTGDTSPGRPSWSTADSTTCAERRAPPVTGRWPSPPACRAIVRRSSAASRLVVYSWQYAHDRSSMAAAASPRPTGSRASSPPSAASARPSWPQSSRSAWMPARRIASSSWAAWVHTEREGAVLVEQVEVAADPGFEVGELPARGQRLERCHRRPRRVQAVGAQGQQHIALGGEVRVERPSRDRSAARAISSTVVPA